MIKLYGYLMCGLGITFPLVVAMTAHFKPITNINGFVYVFFTAFCVLLGGLCIYNIGMGLVKEANNGRLLR